MTVRFWGVRGSIPCQGPSCIRYGGNTSCISLDQGDGRVLVLDAGTGIRQLGKVLAGSSAEIYVLLSHRHLDHVQGFPFFRPLYQPGRRIYVLPTVGGKAMICGLLEQMDGEHFPVTPEQLPSNWTCVGEDPLAFLRDHGFRVASIPTNHPGGAFGYRIERAERSVVYLTDNELDPPGPKVTEFDEFARFCRGADVLVHDAQYLDEDMPRKHGWGHSLASQACELAATAQVRHLVLYHHDPDRTDDELDAVQESARAWLKQHGCLTTCTAAFEGLTLTI